MGKTTGISWTGATWNPFIGCTKVSIGCDNCYMFREQRQYGNDPELVRRSKTKFDMPLKLKEPTLIFTCSWSDWFHKDADEWRPEAWDIIRRSPQHTFQVLTKRPGRIERCLPPDWGDGYPNVWLGVSIETAEFNYRAHQLRAIPAALRFISAEPLLGSLLVIPEAVYEPLDLDGIGWLIVGGESGSRVDARPMNPRWARELREACEAAGVLFHFKQFGSWAVDEGFIEYNRKLRSGTLDKRRFRVWRNPDVNEVETLMHYAGTSPNAGGKLLDGVEHCAIPEPITA